MTTRRKTIRETRAAAYTTGRVLGDLGAALDGPGAYVKRRARARVYAHSSRLTRRLLRGIRL